jgi:hypothetical protein
MDGGTKDSPVAEFVAVIVKHLYWSFHAENNLLTSIPGFV